MTPVATERLRYLARLNPEVPAGVRSDPARDLPYLPMEALGEDWSLRFDQNRPVSAVLAGNSYFENGDILFAKVTPCFENGKAALVSGVPGGSAFGTTEVTVVRPSPQVESKFLFYVLVAADFQQRGRAEMTGAGGLRRVPDRAVRNYRVPLHPRDRQKAIVDYLDRETAEIDAFIADQEKLIELLTERRAAMITSTLTGGAEGSGLLEDLPMGWQLNRFSRVVKINEGQVDPRSDAYKDLPLIAPNHIQSKTGRLLNLETAREQAATSGKYLVDPGQVLYSKIRPALVKAAIAPTRCLSSADMYALSTRNSTVLHNEFLYWLLLSKPFTDYAIDQSARVAMPKLNHETLGAAPIWYPSVNKQARIERVLEESTSRLDATIADARESIALSRERRAALISAAVTGKIDLREHGKGDA